MTDLFSIGKKALRKMIPDRIDTVLTGLDQYGILGTGFNNNPPFDQPQKSYMWEVEFRDPQGRGQSVAFYAKNTAIPTSMSDNLKRWYAGVEYSYSGRDTSPRVFRVTFWDNQNLDTFRFFQQWFNLMNQGRDNRKANPENYLRDVRLVLKDSSDIQKMHVFTMLDCYPTEVGDIALSYAESTEFTFDVMFSFRLKEIGNV